MQTEPPKAHGAPLGRRSLAKAITYRVVVMCADAAAIWILTGTWRIALGFMVASNIYTTALYFLHERLWAHIAWGRAAAGEARPESAEPAALRSARPGPP